jgi:hypothetical protein|tara:strand:- start:3 stop:248 length:246 start_codon:yes stop_codon:yes gene_type:complete
MSKNQTLQQKMKQEIKEDKIRTQLYVDLVAATEKAKALGVQEIVWFGITLFTQIALDCAPSVKAGRYLVKEAAKTVRKDVS